MPLEYLVPMSSTRETACYLLKPCRHGHLDEDVEKGHSPLSWGSPEPERWPVPLHHPQAPAAGSHPSSSGEGDARKGQGPWAVLGSEIASRPQRAGGALMEGRKGHSGRGQGRPALSGQEEPSPSSCFCMVAVCRENPHRRLLPPQCGPPAMTDAQRHRRKAHCGPGSQGR